MSKGNESHLRVSLLLAIAGTLLAGTALAQNNGNLPEVAGPTSTLPLNNQQTRNSQQLSTGTLTAVPDDFANLKLAPGFLLNVEVYDEPELSTQARLDNNGDVTLPFIGAVHLGGKTVSQAEKTVEDKFRKAQILKDPQVTLNVEQYASASITVLGEVQSPGRIQMLAPHSLLDVIGLAGGETNLAGNVIEIKTPSPDGNTATKTYHYARNSNGSSIHDVMVQPGDMITVERAGIVYVLGAVNRPGGYIMQEDGSLNVAQALSMALGTSMQAKIGALRVVRHAPDGQVLNIPISYKGIMDGKVKPIQLHAEDIVYVPVSKVKAALSSGSNVIGQTGAATIYAVH